MRTRRTINVRTPRTLYTYMYLHVRVFPETAVVVKGRCLRVRCVVNNRAQRLKGKNPAGVYIIFLCSDRPPARRPYGGIALAHSLVLAAISSSLGQRANANAERTICTWYHTTVVVVVVVAAAAAVTVAVARRTPRGCGARGRRLTVRVNKVLILCVSLALRKRLSSFRIPTARSRVRVIHRCHLSPPLYNSLILLPLLTLSSSSPTHRTLFSSFPPPDLAVRSLAITGRRHAINFSRHRSSLSIHVRHDDPTVAYVPFTTYTSYALLYTYTRIKVEHALSAADGA